MAAGQRDHRAVLAGMAIICDYNSPYSSKEDQKNCHEAVFLMEFAGTKQFLNTFKFFGASAVAAVPLILCWVN